MPNETPEVALDPETLNPRGSFDARVWAKYWMAVHALHPEIATDEETMVGWFANAIMAGYDHRASEKAAE